MPRVLLLLAFTFFSAAVSAKEETSDGWTYNVNQAGEATIIKYSGDETKLAVPATVDAVPVRHIGDMAFDSRDPARKENPFTAIAMPEGIVSIGAGAFYLCEGITDITIPKTVTKVGESAFSGTSLGAIAIPAGLTNIHKGAFPNSATFTNISVDPENPSYTSIDGVLFDKNRKTLLRYPAGKAGDYAVPDGVDTIAKLAFAGATNLTSISIPASVANVETREFFRCKGLTNVVLPEAPTWAVASLEFPEERKAAGGWTYTVDEAGEATIASYTGDDVEVTVPTELNGIPVKHIGDMVFFSCGPRAEKPFTKITIPEGITSIGGKACAFAMITEIAIPASVNSIGAGAFFRCRELTNISVATGNTNFTSVDGVLFDKNQKVLLQHPAGKKGNYSIPEGVESIGPYAFAASQGLTNLVIPEGVTSLGSSACMDAADLIGVSLPATLTTIGSFAFGHCKSLTEIIIPMNVTSIGEGAFVNTPALTNVVLPASLLSEAERYMLSEELLADIKRRETGFPSQASDASESMTIGGVTYRNATLKSEYPRSLYIQHDGGTAFIERSALSEEQLTALLGSGVN